MATNRRKQIPCRDGLWTMPSEPGEKPQLIGSKCSSCGEVFFPVNPVCNNCQGQDLKEIKLSRKGKIWSYTTVMLAPPAYKGPIPFDLGYVTLPEGVNIYTRFLGAEPGTFKIGQEVELDIDVMQRDAEGNEILGYSFVPVKE